VLLSGTRGEVGNIDGVRARYCVSCSRPTAHKNGHGNGQLPYYEPAQTLVKYLQIPHPPTTYRPAKAKGFPRDVAQTLREVRGPNSFAKGGYDATTTAQTPKPGRHRTDFFRILIPSRKNFRRYFVRSGSELDEDHFLARSDRAGLKTKPEQYRCIDEGIPGLHQPKLAEGPYNVIQGALAKAVTIRKVRGG